MSDPRASFLAEPRPRPTPSPLEAPVPSDVVIVVSGYFAGRGERLEAIWRSDRTIYAASARPGELGPTDEHVFRFGGWDDRGEIVMEHVTTFMGDQYISDEDRDALIAGFDQRARDHAREQTSIDEEADALFRRATISLVWDGDDR